MRDSFYPAFFRWMSALSMGVFLLLCLGVYLQLFSSFDQSISLFIQSIIDRSVDMPLSLVTLLGSSELTAVWLCGIFLFMWKKNKRVSWSLACIALIFLIEVAGKNFLVHHRPPATMNRYTLPFSFPSSSLAPVLYAFPSGHTARSTFLLVILLALIWSSALVQKNKIVLSGCAILYAIVVVVSRISLGAHWFSDVLGGMFLGLSVASFSVSLWSQSRSDFANRQRI